MAGFSEIDIKTDVGVTLHEDEGGFADIWDDKGAYAQAEFACHAVVNGIDMFFAVLGLLEDILGAWEEFLAELGEGDNVGSAEEEFAAEVVFEGFDVLGDGRLGDITTGGGNGEGFCFGYENEGAEVFEFHGKLWVC